MKNFYSPILSLALFASTSYAAPYLSVELGGVEGDISFSTPYTYADSSQFVLISRIAGGYLWERNDRLKYGVEAGYTHFNEIENDFNNIQLKYRQYQLDILGVLDYCLVKNVNVFAKAGYGYANQTATANGFQSTYSHSFHDSFAKGAVGIGYNLCQNINLNVTLVNNFGFDNPKRNILAGIKYTFN